MGVVGRLDQYASMLAYEFDDYSMSENLVSYSTYTASNWINNFPAGASITTGITAPDGTNTAVRLTCTNTTNALLRVNIPSLTPNGTDNYTTSFYVRKISGTGGAFTDLGDGNPSADYSSQLVTNQWVRVTVSGVPTATAKTFLDLFSDNNTNYVLDFWGVQLEKSSVATDYTPTTTTAISRVLPSTTNTNITGLGTYYSSGFDENVGFTTFLPANIFAPYDLVYDEFGGTLFGAGQGRYMRQNTDKSVIVYNEIDEVTDLFGRGIVRDGLILDLDAGISVSYSGIGTTWTDLSARGNNFTLYGSPSLGVDGKSLSFNGVNQYANIGSSELNLAPVTTTTPSTRTIEVWAKVNANISAGLVGGLFGDQYSSTGALVVDDFRRLMWRWDDAGTPTQKVVQLEEWFQIVVLLQNSYQIEYYVNGQLDTAQFTSPDTSANICTGWSIARQNRDFTGDFRHLNCNVSVARQYDRILTAAEISQNFNALKGRFGL